MSDSTLLAAIDARTSRIEEMLGKLTQAVFLGNGKESLMTRVSLLEDDHDQFLAQCRECKAVKPAESASENLAEAVIAQQTELKKTGLLESWKFRALAWGGLLTLTIEVLRFLSTGKP